MFGLLFCQAIDIIKNCSVLKTIAFPDSSMVERAAVNRQVLGSNPSRGANFTLSFLISCQIFTYMYTVYVLLSLFTVKYSILFVFIHSPASNLNLISEIR